MALLKEAKLTFIYVGKIETAANFIVVLIWFTMMKIIIVNNNSLLHKECLLSSKHRARNLIKSKLCSQHSTIITRTVPNIWDLGQEHKQSPRSLLHWLCSSLLTHSCVQAPSTSSPLHFTSHKHLPLNYQCPWEDRPGEDSLRSWNQGSKWRKFWSFKYRKYCLGEFWACLRFPINYCLVGNTATREVWRRFSEAPSSGQEP